jgi:hypothetical protein
LLELDIELILFLNFPYVAGDATISIKFLGTPFTKSFFVVSTSWIASSISSSIEAPAVGVNEEPADTASAKNFVSNSLANAS